jgi:hypothetical protein
MTQLQKRGLVAIVICSKPFEGLAKGQARIHGCADLPLVLIDHPLGGMDMATVQARAGQAVPQIINYLRSIPKT